MGNTGGNKLFGYNGNDRIFGRAGNDTLFGGDGNDILNGGIDNDILVGGQGLDLYRFDGVNFGLDQIIDFDLTELIDLRAVAGITDFADLLANHLTQNGADAVITDITGEVRIENVLIGDLTIQNFLIAGLSPIDLEAGSDTGASNTDGLTNDTTPTIEFLTDPGNTVQIDWGDGNGFVPGAVGTGIVQQETLAGGYATDGVKTIQVQAADATGFVFSQNLVITIDTAASLSAIDLIDASDDGPSNADDISGDITPTIEFTAETGATVAIDWGDGNGFVAAVGAGTGAPQQETLATPYVANGLKPVQVMVTDLAGNTVTQTLNITTVGVGPDNVIGGAPDDNMFGYTGDDQFLLRYGNDTATGGDGADLFKFDGRYVNNGDAHTITDLNFAEGDAILFRFFGAGTFNDLLDPGNPMNVTNSGATATLDSRADIQEAHLNGVLQASDTGNGDTLLTISSGPNQLTVELDGILFSSLNIPVGPVDLSPTDDTLRGTAADDSLNGYGGDDTITMRYGSDTAIGGTGGDLFILDGRYLNNGDAHTITDLNFSEGDRLEIRFMDAGTFDDTIDPANTLRVLAGGTKALFNSVEDILEMAGNGVITGADDGFGGIILTGTVGINTFTLTLDGIDIF